MALPGLISAIVIAIVQGVTEWLPISSSGHLVIAEKLLGYPADLTFDVALHFGTLMAAFVYFGGDITDMVREISRGNIKKGKGRLGVLLILATIPAAVAGYLLKPLIEEAFSSLLVVAFGFLVTALLLFIASLSRKGKTKAEEITMLKAAGIGVVQIASLLPGVSRSGSTISSGIFLGLDEKEAARFSFLMSIPIVFGANVLTIGNTTLPPHLIWATLVSFVVGLLTLFVLFRYVLTSRSNLRWFGVYALLLSIILLIWEFFL